MISKARARFIKSLQLKKYRLAEQCFLVHGAKALKETLSSDYEVQLLAGTASFLDSLKTSEKSRAHEIIEVNQDQLSELSAVESNDAGLAVVRMKAPGILSLKMDEMALVLDDIRDPGNLGTIIRMADWFGLKNIIASEETTELYNPKVINASMGSFLRVQLTCTRLPDFLKDYKGKVMGTFLDGEDVHRFAFPSGGLIVIGNESKGISSEVEKFITHRITIPRYGHAESLNASVATAIVLDNWRRMKNE